MHSISENPQVFYHHRDCFSSRKTDKVRKDKMEFSAKRLRKYYKNMSRNNPLISSVSFRVVSALVFISSWFSWGGQQSTVERVWDLESGKLGIPSLTLILLNTAYWWADYLTLLSLGCCFYKMGIVKPAS